MMYENVIRLLMYLLMHLFFKCKYFFLILMNNAKKFVKLITFNDVRKYFLKKKVEELNTGKIIKEKRSLSSMILEK